MQPSSTSAARPNTPTPSGTITSSVIFLPTASPMGIRRLTPTPTISLTTSTFTAWGHECRITGGHQWDIWDNQGQKWHPTGITCNPNNNAWNHLTIQVQRTSDNHAVPDHHPQRPDRHSQLL